MTNTSLQKPRPKALPSSTTPTRSMTSKATKINPGLSGIIRDGEPLSPEPALQANLSSLGVTPRQVDDFFRDVARLVPGEDIHYKVGEGVIYAPGCASGNALLLASIADQGFALVQTDSALVAVRVNLFGNWSIISGDDTIVGDYVDIDEWKPAKADVANAQPNARNTPLIQKLSSALICALRLRYRHVPEAVMHDIVRFASILIGFDRDLAHYDARVPAYGNLDEPGRAVIYVRTGVHDYALITRQRGEQVGDIRQKLVRPCAG